MYREGGSPMTDIMCGAANYMLSVAKKSCGATDMCFWLFKLEKYTFSQKFSKVLHKEVPFEKTFNGLNKESK